MPSARRAGRRRVTDVRSGAQRLVKAADIAGDPLAGQARRSICAAARAAWQETAEGRVFLTVHVPSPRLVITGAVHISQALAPIGRLLGYDVTIVDPRTAFASVERFPDVKVIAEWPDTALPPLGIDRYTAFVALTHDPKIDDPALTHALARDCFYIGALGSKKTHARRVERLKAQGISDADIARIHAPIGLKIGATIAGRDRGRHHGRDHRAAAARRQAEAAGMKFGPVAPADALGATAVHTIRQGALVLKKGTLIGSRRSRRAQGRRHRRGRGRAPRAGRRVRGRGRIGDRRRGRRGGGARIDLAFTGRCNLFAERPACSSSTRTRSTGSTASTRRSRSPRCRPTSRSWQAR